MNRNQRFHELSLTAHELHLLCIKVASSGCNLNAMHSNAKYLIELVKSRQEKDNISVVLVKAE